MGGIIVLKNVNVIPMTSEIVLTDMAVLIKDGKIEDIGRFEDLTLPDGAYIIDAHQGYLLPGLNDMHVHIDRYFSDEAALFLANGVLYVRNMWGNEYHLTAREDIKNGVYPGPEIYTTGPVIDGKGAYWPMSMIIDDPGLVAEKIKEMKDMGYDAIKVYEKLKPDVYDEIIKAAKSQGIPVVGHVPMAVSMKHVINSGQLSIEHFDGFYELVYDSHDYKRLVPDFDELIDLSVKKGVWHCPTFSVYYKRSDPQRAEADLEPLLQYATATQRRWWPKTRSFYFPSHDHKKILAVLYERGGKTVSGTDYGNSYIVAGFSLHEELEYMCQAGLTPYEVILTSTRNAAELTDRLHRSGTIEAGKDADLVLLEKNPLIDIKNTRTVKGIVVKGKWFPKEKLEQMLNEVAENNTWP